MPVIFVNYRVRDQPGYATLVHHELARLFGAHSVFLAASSLRAGDDYTRAIFENLRRCEVLLAFIGPYWSQSDGPADADRDWVYREIAEAFAAGLRVVPVLLEEVDLPRAANLPPAIAALATTQYVRLRHYTVDADLNYLVGLLRGVVPALRESSARSSVGASRLSFEFAYPARRCRIGVIPGDIRRVTYVDIWVNSENTDMQMPRVTEFSVSAIIRYLGAKRDKAGHITRDLIADDLDARIGARRPVAPGTAVITTAGELAAGNGVRHIIHVAAVQGEPGDGYRQVRDISGCVRNVLTLATRLAEHDPRVRAILFPLLGVGIGGAPLEPTVRAMLRAVLDFLVQQRDTELTGIYFLAYTDREHDVLDQVLRELPLIPIGAGPSDEAGAP
jgi:O-acetyl-ADP-ribose deacetylase (regulator of RNase III)